MRLPITSRRNRRGFTLIELLVVIAIISILVGLTSVAIFKYLAKGPETKALSEIEQMSMAITQFKAKMGGVRYVPSRIVLREDMNYPNTALDQDSKNYLLAVFGRNLGSAGGVDWNGNGTIDTGPPGIHYLEGDQCLVFFLGGIPRNGQLEGFSSSDVNPAKPGGQRRRFFEFKANRLVVVPPVSGSPRSTAFPSYKDPWGTTPGSVYAYFSSYGVDNGYPKYGLPGDCASLGLTGGAYHLNGQFYHPGGFQIITAGSNGVFGPGGQWSPKSAGAIGPQGEDDFSNFHPRKMGAED